MADKIKPLAFRWLSGTMAPIRPDTAARQFVENEIYILEPYEERSMRSHKFYFAAIREGWLNLPDNLSERFATPEHLRKWLLIKCGYRKERTLTLDSPEAAQRVAAFMRSSEEYAIIVSQGNVVVEYTAESQSMKAMGKMRFEESKQRILDELAKLLGVDVTDLERNKAA